MKKLLSKDENQVRYLLENEIIGFDPTPQY